MQGGDDLAHFGARDHVIDVLAVAPGFDEVVGPQARHCSNGGLRS